jgi:hypothetical protein
VNKTLKTSALGAIVFLCALKLSCAAVVNLAARISSSCTIIGAELCALFSAGAITAIVMILISRYSLKKTPSDFPTLQSSRDLSR